MPSVRHQVSVTTVVVPESGIWVIYENIVCNDNTTMKMPVPRNPARTW